MTKYPNISLTVFNVNDLAKDFIVQVQLCDDKSGILQFVLIVGPDFPIIKAENVNNHIKLSQVGHIL